MLDSQQVCVSSRVKIPTLIDSVCTVVLQVSITNMQEPVMVSQGPLTGWEKRTSPASDVLTCSDFPVLCTLLHCHTNPFAPTKYTAMKSVSLTLGPYPLTICFQKPFSSSGSSSHLGWWCSLPQMQGRHSPILGLASMKGSHTQPGLLNSHKSPSFSS